MPPATPLPPVNGCTTAIHSSGGLDRDRSSVHSPAILTGDRRAGAEGPGPEQRGLVGRSGRAPGPGTGGESIAHAKQVFSTARLCPTLSDSVRLDLDSAQLSSN